MTYVNLYLNTSVDHWVCFIWSCYWPRHYTSRIRWGVRMYTFNSFIREMGTRWLSISIQIDSRHFLEAARPPCFSKWPGVIGISEATRHVQVIITYAVDNQLHNTTCEQSQRIVESTTYWLKRPLVINVGCWLSFDLSSKLIKFINF